MAVTEKKPIKITETILRCLSKLPYNAALTEQISKHQHAHKRSRGRKDHAHNEDEWAILPSLIFMGVGAMTDFGPLIANPKSFLLGAAAQFGIFTAYLGGLAMGTSAFRTGLLPPFLPQMPRGPGLQS